MEKDLEARRPVKISGEKWYVEDTVQERERESTRGHPPLLRWALVLGAGSSRELGGGAPERGAWEADVPGKQPGLQVPSNNSNTNNYHNRYRALTVPQSSANVSSLNPHNSPVR